RPYACELIVAAGPCMFFISAFYYSKGANKCYPFTYSGCRGNANRFKTIEECRRTCVV
uniref:Mambaquaretin-7 n=1 Tax=Dendroaspis polylepis polylepis TaxID=8620 RepID=MAMB7_DENPO|nr:RecName: Full=Mambaquaretin-7; Short=MQ7; AltName: Full=Kunitz-type serine protease inhibitor homolog dendrotoxin B; Short=DTX-B; AltName: Full=Mambaquaretin-8; Short=MQ8; AltName: Full=Protein B; AltName: Full=Upsilon-Dp2b; AltName: Full=Upsilon-Dp2c; AltName: Full=Venom basic protease inhibitor B [Dendroaspis polylepis polylepis]